MATLIVEPFGSGSIEIGMTQTASMDEFWIWQKMPLKLLFCAFLDRPACLITVAPQPWSLGQELTTEPKLVIDNEPYLLAFRDSCSAELLTSVAESEDFENALLWLTSLGKEDTAKIVNLVRAVKESNFLLNNPHVSEELLIRGNDGNAIYWFNHHQPLHNIIHTLTELTQSVGWNLDATAVDSLRDG